ncbi:hypothetical protein PVAND_007999 [Polypedilum vanderplanki]|uniref:Uncharacterized protein n=1 Tax=Polypedilum vanderplanki TaxID=319348 RepID=A0A9J6C8C1_POLVA|nr:hypothetical protein PVAND_007999 [Polypedilum vanderplanki]
MDAWLTDVKQIRIPRPKYNSNSSSNALKNLIEKNLPPRDYDLDLTKNCRQETQKSSSIMDAENLQHAFQEKL